MTHYILFLFPLFSAFIGWAINRIALIFLFRPHSPVNILGFKLQGILPKHKQHIAVLLAKEISNQLPFSVVRDKITNAGDLQKIMPIIEEHIEHFLRVKLKEKMPMIAMFIGDKTIEEFKSIFVKELEIMLPQLIQTYADNLEKEFDVERLVTCKIAMLTAEQIETTIGKTLAKPLQYITWLGAVTGFVVGVLCIIIFI